MHTILTIVVAAGSGTRMGTEIPKQFLTVDGEPIVMKTLRRMDEGVAKFLTGCSPDMDKTGGNLPNVDNHVHKLALVLPEAYIPYWRELCEKHRFGLTHTVVAGGETRFQSVKNGLAVASEADIVLVHDGVRPLADDGVIARVIRTAMMNGAAVPVVPVIDSLRRISGGDGHSVAVDRAEFRAVQTPQGFRGDLLREAYSVLYDERFTDDASVVELSGLGTVALTEGSPANIKITTPADLAVAQVLLEG